MKRAVPVAAACAAVAFMLAACAGTNASPQAVPPPTLGPISAITSLGQITRPIDPYLATPAQARELEQAMNAVTADCMAGYGLPAIPSTPTDFAALARAGDARSELYGFFDPGVVAKQGYDVLEAGPASRAVPSAAQISVLTGRTEAGVVVAEYQGKSIPSGGCHQTAVNAIGGLPPIPGASGELPDGGPQVPLTDPRMLSVDAKWSACMKVKGYAYATPADAYIDAKWRPIPGRSPSQSEAVMSAEIATATADLACKQTTGL